MLTNTDERAAVAATQADLRLLYSGTLAHSRGIYDALLGLREARRRGAAVRLSIAGCGPDYLLLRRFIEILRLEREARFIETHGLGATAELRECDALLLPALSRGLPRLLLDAMARGIPVVATRGAVTAALIAHGRNGLLLDAWEAGAIGAAIARLAAGAPRRAALFG